MIKRRTVPWSLWSFLCVISCVKGFSLIEYCPYARNASRYFVDGTFFIPPRSCKRVNSAFIFQARKLSSERQSHLLRGHTAAQRQKQDLNSDALGFKAIPFLLRDTLYMKTNQNSKRLFFLSL